MLSQRSKIKIEYILDDSIYIRCKLIYNDTKQISKARGGKRDRLQRDMRVFGGNEDVLFGNEVMISLASTIDIIHKTIYFK